MWSAPWIELQPQRAAAQFMAKPIHKRLRLIHATQRLQFIARMSFGDISLNRNLFDFQYLTQQGIQLKVSDVKTSDTWKVRN